MAQNNFATTHTPIEVSAEASKLPKFKGSGWVRDLGEAAMLAPELISLVENVRLAAVRSQYVVSVGDLIRAWGNNSGYKTASDTALEMGKGLTLRDPIDEQEEAWMEMAIKASTEERNAFRARLSDADLVKFDRMRESMVGDLERLYAYEAFTGFTFLTGERVLKDAESYVDPAPVIGNGGRRQPIKTWVPLSTIISENRTGVNSRVMGYVRVTIPEPLEGLPHITNLWNRLVEDVSKNLMPQLRLSKYLDTVGLSVTDTGIQLDFSQLNAALDQLKTADAAEGAAVFLDLYKMYGDTFSKAGWNSTEQLRGVMQAALDDAGVEAAFSAAGLHLLNAANIQGSVENDIYAGNQAANKFYAGAGDDLIEGQGGNDELSGGIGHDVLLGGTGDDTLYGEDGNDTLDGGTGNDFLVGGYGNDTYLFGKGDGYDTISSDYDPSPGKLNVLRFKAGIQASDVRATRSGSHLLLGMADGDAVRINDFFYGNRPANAYNPIQQVQFEDGTVWDTQALLQMTLEASSADDVLTGTPGNDVMDGLAGNDTLFGAAGDDQLFGGEGNDQLHGNEGNDTLDAGVGNDMLNGGAGDDVLLGGAGDDTLYGEEGNDTLDGGAGKDFLVGDAGNDTYLFGKGDGYDTISSDYDPSPGKLNVLRFKAGIQASDVRATRSGSHLLLGMADGDAVRINDFFYGNRPVNAYNPIQQVQFEDGTVWDTQALLQMTLEASSADDVLTGTPGNDVMDGLAGNDTLFGAAGDDQLFGGEGNDQLHGNEGNDTLDAGVGNDMLNGGAGDDVLLGGAGDDTLYGEEGNDTLDGGAGKDFLVGDAGNDTYLFGKGDGYDTISSDYDPSPGKLNVLRFKAGIQASDVRATRSGSHLLLGMADGDAVRINDFFYGNRPANAYNPIQQVQFEDGTVWDTQALLQMTLEASSADDVLTGTPGNDVMDGLAGNDTLFGAAGDDQLFGGEGNDQLHGNEGNDTLDAGVGNDMLNGGAGDDVLLGGAGDDTLYGEEGNDTLDGGAGKDFLVGDAGNDTYLFGKGDGYDTISSDYDPSPGKLNVLRFKAGIQASDVRATRSGSHLLLGMADGDAVRINDFFYGNRPVNAYNPIQQVQFEDGTVWDTQALLQMTLKGSPGNDRIFGTGGDDVLRGAQGNDYLNGGAGSDTYLFARGDGADTISDYDTTPGNTDTLSFEQDVAFDQLWLRRDGQNLEVSIIGTNDKSTIENWYADPAYRIEQFKAGDGRVLIDSQVNALVSAMAAFAPPAAGQTVLPPDYRTALAPVLAAGWN
ncbi:calcium-binding protein [Delftia sp. PS-11]|uniref:calcium-binding protein n=1 Tax=Delftia sp. PS-11 TaxID=2767222 RepID=UPI003AB61A88